MIMIVVVEGRKMRAEKKTRAYSLLLVVNMTHSPLSIVAGLVILFYRMIS